MDNHQGRPQLYLHLASKRILTITERSSAFGALRSFTIRAMAKVHAKPPAHNTFISWSGTRSLHVAEAMRDWLQKVIPGLKPWLSVREIPKGRRGGVDIWEALEGINIGIICLTKENVLEPWILFESGALSKTYSETTTLVCTYLLGGLNHSDLPAPLRDFQYTRPDREDTRKMVLDIAEAVKGEEMSEPEKAQVNAAFNSLWPEFESQLNTMPSADDAITVQTVQEAIVDKSEAVPASTGNMVGTAAGVSTASGTLTEWRPWGQTIWVKRKGKEELEYVDGRTYEITPEPGVLIIYRGPNVLKEFHDVEDWGFWGEDNGAEVKAKYKVDPKLG